MRLLVDPLLFERFPGALLGVAVARGIDNAGDPPAVAEQLREAQARVRGELAGTALAEHPRIAPWRAAYRLFGATPKKHHSSIEALLRRVLAGEELRRINPLVDLYNAISLNHLLPAGGEDLERVEGDVRLTFAGADEPPVRLLGDPEPRPPSPGEVVYRDDAGVLCRRWNWREAERTKLTAETRDALLVLEALPPIPRQDLERAVAELAGLVERFCGGRMTTALLDVDHPDLELGS